MQHRTLGRTGMSAGIFAFGGIVVDKTPQVEADNIVAEAVDAGINYFDVAPSYGQAQDILGPALKPFRKNSFLACKSLCRDKAGMQSELHASLKALQTDYFDVYQLHEIKSLDEVEQVFAPGGAMEALQAAKQDGLARYIGFSAHQEDAALAILERFDFDTMLFPINWALMIKKGMGTRLLKIAAQRNMGRLALKSLAHGPKESPDDGFEKCWYRPIFDNDTLAELALRFTLSQDVHVAVSPGDVRMLRKGIAIMQKYGGNPPPLSEAEYNTLNAHAGLMENTIF